MNKKNNSQNIISNFPFFYGYVIIFAGTIGVLMSIPGQTIGVSVFTGFLVDSLGITRDNLSLAYLIGTISSSFILTFAGKFFDKFGARITSVLSGFLLGVSLYFLSEIEIIRASVSNFFSSIDLSVITFILLAMGFFAIRFFGQGVLTMSSRNMTMKWFEKRRGISSAFMGAAISFGFSYAPVAFDNLISVHGWETTWKILAVIVGIFFSIFAFILFRDNPQEYNLTQNMQ